MMGWGRSHFALAGLAGAALAVGLMASGRTVGAEASLESPYGYARTWNAALRLVRVDNAWKVTEKDESSGYILFEYRSPENVKVTPGSVELVRGREPFVNVLVRLPQMPRYHEQVVLDSLAAKMRREYGDPPPPPKGREDPREPPTDAPDGGSDPHPEGDAG
jgi:hypothetical protein